MSIKINASHKIFFLFFFVTFLFSPATGPQPTYLYHNCSTNKTFAANSAFQTDRTTLLSSLTSNNNAHTDFFNTTVVGGGYTVYGHFMCRGDVPVQLCHQCVFHATQRLASECRFSKEAIIWYDECLIRYSNCSFFSSVDTRPRYAIWNSGDTSDEASFMILLFATMNETADEAAKPARGEKKYATKETNISKFHTLYCLAQCSPDLSPQECRKCLRKVIGDLDWCCEGKQGGRILSPSCNVRYELYPFYHTEAPTTPAIVLPANTSALGAVVSGEKSARRTERAEALPPSVAG